MVSIPSMLRWQTICLLLGMCFFGCTEKKDDATTASAEEATPVRIALPERDEVIDIVRAESTLRPRAQLTLLSEQIGEVRALHADVGDAVTKNEVLANIYHQDLDLQIQQAADTLRAQEKELEKSRPLWEQGYLPRQAFDELTLARDQSKIQLQRLRATQADQRIKAPFDGVILERAIEQGQKIAAGSPLFEIADLSALYLRIPVPERALQRIHVGQPATIELRALVDASVPAKVRKIFPSVDPSTGTILVELELDRTTLDDDTALRPGMYARGEIEVERRPNILMVPRKALVEEGAETYLLS